MHRLLLVLLASFSLFAQQPQFFVQMADPQLGMYTNNADTLQEEANLNFVVGNINRLRPAFVVVCGDLVNKAGDSHQVETYRRIVKSIDRRIPVYNVAGNHDVGNRPTPASLAEYRKAFGKDYYSFDACNIRGLVLNSNLIAVPDSAPQETEAQEKWLVRELERARRDHVANVLVFQHISYFLESPDEPDQYFNIPRKIRDRYLARFHDYGVTHLFAGHYHRNAYGRDGNIEMVTTGPVGKPLGRDQSGFRIVQLVGSALEHHYYELGSIPNSIRPGEELPTFPAPAKH
jgi:3',5'-cyclic AMP phosphodiesterase CpdA